MGYSDPLPPLNRASLLQIPQIKHQITCNMNLKTLKKRLWKYLIFACFFLSGDSEEESDASESEEKSSSESETDESSENSSDISSEDEKVTFNHMLHCCFFLWLKTILVTLKAVKPWSDSLALVWQRSWCFNLYFSFLRWISKNELSNETMIQTTLKTWGMGK